MTTRPGYNGKLLRINLTLNKVSDEEIDEKICRKYLGGGGFVAYYLWKELKPGTDALSPDNILIFALGPTTGVTLPGVSRNSVGGKSPLTGGIAKSEVGGYWMVELKRAGYDVLIIEGKSEKPVYIWITDGKAEIRDAAHLWGKETLETETAIRNEFNDKHIQVAMIGPGGENLVRFACILEGCHDAAGRGGLGAVMGSKNLKAVAVRGHTQPPVFNTEVINKLRQQLSGPNPISDFGTGGPSMLQQLAEGDLPTRNYRDGNFEGAKKIHGGIMKDIGIRIGMEGCFACPLRCKKVIRFEEPYKVDPRYGGPEYETIASLGTDVGIDDVKSIVKGNERCNAYSLDTISTGSTIAFAIECYEKGLITKADTGGLELKWGDPELIQELIELIARSKGFGKVLGEGTLRMAKKIGKGCEAFAMHGKGLEPGMHEPRISSLLFMSFLVNPIGADHCFTSPDGVLSNEMLFQPFHVMGWQTPASPFEVTPRKMGIFRDSQFQNALLDAMLFCHFPGINFEQITELIKGITGWDTGLVELIRIAERNLTLMRLFNYREGLSGSDDKLPDRFYGPTTNGPLSNHKVDREAYEKALKYYYVLMGWDEYGRPRPEKLEELGIPLINYSQT